LGEPIANERRVKDMDKQLKKKLKTSIAQLGEKSILIVFGIILLGLLLPSKSLSQELNVGMWGGNYTLHTGERLDARYIIKKSENTDDENTDEMKYIIKMVILDSEPQKIYKTKKVLIEKKNLMFTLLIEDEESTCKLTKNENDQYLGNCQSSLDPEGSMLSKISMVPPKKE
jgi:hypothetical protein